MFKIKDVQSLNSCKNILKYLTLKNECVLLNSNLSLILSLKLAIIKHPNLRTKDQLKCKVVIKDEIQIGSF